MGQDQKNAVFIIKSRSGQAVVEYLLLMVIIVALCIGIGKGFGVLNGFLNKYIGDYTRCLMEYGELPSLGVKVPELNRHMSGTGKKCDEKFQTFSFDEGFAAVGGTTGGNQNSAGSNSNSNSGSNPNGRGGNSSTNNKGSNAAKKGNSGDSDSTNSGGGDGSGNAGNGSDSKSPYKNGQIARAGSPFGTADGGVDEAQRVKIIELDEEENTSRKRKNKNYSLIRNDYDRSGYRAVTGRMQEEYQKTIKNKISRAPSTTVTTIKGGDAGGFMPIRKTLPQRTYEKQKEQDSDNSGFSFGGLLRFLIIAGMIVAIVIFFGGQVLNYSNSKD